MLAAEEPLEIRVDGQSLAVTMRTPGHDVELAHGFLLTEGVIGGREDIVDGPLLRLAGRRRPQHLQRPRHRARPRRAAARRLGGAALLHDLLVRGVRQGVAGRGAHEDPLRPGRRPAAPSPTEVLVGLPDTLRAAQAVFDSTGGLHAAGLFRADGTLLVAREDVGRHNAVDKVVGHMLLEGGVPARGTVLMVSGRASFELTQKAVMAGIPALAAVSAPSSLAVEMARESGMTLVGFLRGHVDERLRRHRADRDAGRLARDGLDAPAAAPGADPYRGAPRPPSESR